MDSIDPLAELETPAPWSPRPDRVETLETHISRLYFVGDRVYKVKKPVDLGFLDFTTLERRRHYCEEEVRLNAPLAPGVCLGVVPIARDRHGKLRVGGEGETVEWAVEMRRLPGDRMLAALLDRGEVDNQMWNELVERLMRFHAEAATGPGVDEHGLPEAVARNVRENFEQTRSLTGTPRPGTCDALSSALHGFLEERAERFLDRFPDLLARRVQTGRIRDGHGDLHAENICFAREGLIIYDRIEFSERFRSGDVACDLAFLAMDLDHAGFPGFSGWLVKRYAHESGDRELAELVPFYKAYRAIVRAKVAGIRLRSLQGEDREHARIEAAGYFQLAAGYELPPALILLCGLPATGKTSVARGLARALRAPLLRSDVRRKVLAGVPSREHSHEALGSGLYSPEMGARTYRSLLEHAVHEVESGHGAIVDATFSTREMRAPFVDAMTRLSCPLRIVWLTASEEQVRSRLELRAQDPDEASDADWQVYLHAKESFEPPTEVPAGTLCALDVSDRSPVDLSGAVLDCLIPAAAKDGWNRSADQA